MHKSIAGEVLAFSGINRDCAVVMLSFVVFIEELNLKSILIQQ